MNYLAHALLAEPHAGSVIGNIAGDLVKGRIENHALHPRVADGVRRHRRVDALTDSHPRFRDLLTLFPPVQRRIAPIVLDVLFDHYLFRDWPQFSRWRRDAFIDGVYAVLLAPPMPLPDALAAVAPRWVQADWLRVYASMEGVAAVLERLSCRASRPLPLAPALLVAQRHDGAFADAFAEIFVDVRERLDTAGRTLAAAAAETGPPRQQRAVARPDPDNFKEVS